jgi:hypothetical protein
MQGFSAKEGSRHRPADDCVIEIHRGRDADFDDAPDAPAKRRAGAVPARSARTAATADQFGNW